MANQKYYDVDMPDEFKAKMNQWLEEYQQSGEGSLQEFLEEKSAEQQEEEDRQRREQEEQQRRHQNALMHNVTQMVFSGSSYLKDLAKQAGEDQQADKTKDDKTRAQELQQNISKEGQQVYHYKGDPDAGTPDMDITKKENNFFKSSNDPNDFNFSRTSPKGLNGQSFEARGLTPEDKKEKIEQINRIEDKTFSDMAKSHPELKYERKETEDNKIEHQFRNKENNSHLTHQQENNLKKEFFSKANKYAEQEATKNNQDAPEVKAQHSSELPRPKFTAIKEIDEKKGAEAQKQQTASAAPSADMASDTMSASNAPTLKPK